MASLGYISGNMLCLRLERFGNIDDSIFHPTGTLAAFKKRITMVCDYAFRFVIRLGRKKGKVIATIATT
jgi:hypothetical protein